LETENERNSIEERFMKHVCMGFLVFLLLVSVSCTPKAAGPDVETIGDLVFVHNPALPLHPDRSVEFVEELGFGGDETDEEAMLYQPRDILVDARGFIHVSDYRDAVIKVYDQDGRYVRTIGRKGEGPGEFQSLSDMKFLDDAMLSISIPHTPHSIFAGDPARKRLYHCLNDAYLIEVYEPPGKLVRKIDRPCITASTTPISSRCTSRRESWSARSIAPTSRYPSRRRMPRSTTPV
jgi:hypothetical protein